MKLVLGRGKGLGVLEDGVGVGVSFKGSNPMRAGWNEVDGGTSKEEEIP